MTNRFLNQEEDDDQFYQFMLAKKKIAIHEQEMAYASYMHDVRKYEQLEQ